MLIPHAGEARRGWLLLIETNKKQIPLPRVRERDDIVGPSSAVC
jgi:hypothetical protein